MISVSLYDRARNCDFVGVFYFINKTLATLFAQGVEEKTNQNVFSIIKQVEVTFTDKETVNKWVESFSSDYNSIKV